MKRKPAILLLLSIIASSHPAFARVDVQQDTAAQIEMNVRLEIPTHLSLKIGTQGTQVDTVSFNVTGLPQAQPRVEGDLHPVIELSSNLPTGCDLTADSTAGLVGATTTIPFTTISFQGTGALSGVKGIFTGTANQKIHHLGGKGKGNGAMGFVYNNTYKYPPGIYTGTVTFTLSTP